MKQKSFSLRAMLLVSVAASTAQAAAPSPACEAELTRAFPKSVTKHIQSSKLTRKALDTLWKQVPEEIRKKYNFVERDGKLRLQVLEPGLRNVTQPSWLANSVTRIPNEQIRSPRLHPHSRLNSIIDKIDAVTVDASNTAYDIRERLDSSLDAVAILDFKETEKLYPGYRVINAYADSYSGFKGFALEFITDDPQLRHRIYAAAGSETFENTDFRDWATGLMMARGQMVANAALIMVRDAALYAADPNSGGEVLFTGQSQGGLIAQGLGFLAQSLLNSEGRPHRLVHVVAWGATGALEPLKVAVSKARNGQYRGFPSRIETHLRFISPQAAAAHSVFNKIRDYWIRSVPSDQSVEASIWSVASQMRVVAYFFELDIFARAGTFIGQTYVFPLEFAIPDECETLRVEDILGFDPGSLSFALEGHFLQGYKRAVLRGGIPKVFAAKPEKWAWLHGLQEALEPMGRYWLEGIFVGNIASSERNWKLCKASGHWITDQNRDCSKDYWPGCSPDRQTNKDSTEANWCLVTKKPTSSWWSF